MVKGGGCGRGICPLPRDARKFFFTGGRYLMHDKVFSLGQVHSSYQIFH